MNILSDKIEDIFSELNTSERGLASYKIPALLKKFGDNRYNNLHAETARSIYFAQLRNPLIIVLFIISIISIMVGEYSDGGIILVMLFINSFIGFRQEYKARKSLERLNKLITLKSTVIRDSKIIKINSNDIVPGDIVILNKGDVVPADVRLIECKNFIVNESSLTGESMDVQKSLTIPQVKNPEPYQILNCAFQGTSVTEGFARGVVVGTSTNTFFGKAVNLSATQIDKTNFQTHIERFTKVLFYFVIFIIIAAVFINIYLGRDIMTAFILGVALALGITPETMPIIISISLSNAAYNLSKHKVLVKRLSVFEDLGSINILCTDKTGTITTGVLTVHDFLNDEMSDNASDIEELKTLSTICNANNPSLSGRLMPNPIDDAITKDITVKKLDKAKELNIAKVWDFEFDKRMMGVCINQGKDYKTVIKGAYESIIEMTSPANKADTLKKLQQYESRGYRIIAIATAVLKEPPSSLDSIKNPKLNGFILFYDPPRKDMKEEFTQLEKHNISLKIISGDSAEVTREVCQKVGLNITDDKVISGQELDILYSKGEIEFDECVSKYNVYSRITPVQKLQIVSSLKKSGNVVGYVGDGINDVGSIKAADVGISVDTGVEVAKDCADIIILDKELSTILTGVIEGRKVFVNTMKFIFSAMSSSFGNVITLTFASAFLKFIPLLPAQVMLVDSVSDVHHLAIASDNVDPELLQLPQNWNMHAFVKYVIIWGVVSTISDIFHIIVILSLSANPEFFRAAFIIESNLTEALATMSLRTSHSIFHNKPSHKLLLFSVLAVGISVLIAVIPFTANWFGLVPPTLIMFGVIALISTIYFFTLEIIKRGFFAEFWKIK